MGARQHSSAPALAGGLVALGLALLGLALLGLAGCAGGAAQKGGAAAAPAGEPAAAGAASAGPSQAPAQDDTARSELGDGETPAERAVVAAVEKAVNDNARAMFGCWARGAADNFHLEGQVTLALEVGKDGTGQAVRVVKDTTDDPVVVDCLKQLWMKTHWPAEVAGQTIQLPPVDYHAPAAQYRVRGADAPRHPLGKSGPAAASTAQVLLDEDNTGNGSAALTLLEMAPGMTVPMHQHPDSAELIYILSGKARLLGRRPRTVAAGDALYIPAGAPHGVENRGKQPVVAVQLYAPAGPEQRFLGRPATGTMPVTGRPAARPRPRVVATRAAHAYPGPGGTGQVRILFDQKAAGDTASSLEALTLAPGAVVPPHRHPASSEYLYVIEGAGVLTVAGEELALGPGDAVQIPSGIEHAFKVTGTVPVKSLQFYTPSGPEQRFRKPARPPAAQEGPGR